MIAPPYSPYAPALAAQGVRLSRLMLLQPKTVDERVWACEQALRTNGCGAVLIWLGHAQERALRRLQLAAERSDVLAMMFRPSRSAPFSSAALRLHVSKTSGGTVVRILKRRGGGIPVPIVLDLHGAIAARPAVSQRTTTIVPACLAATAY
jgi:cell division inhibitor SulA/protein ImuA